jgi:DNA helicase-2/ATP-dependent DNA helicase PcrA
VIVHGAHWYSPHLERRYEDARIREADLLQLAQIASTYPNRQRFLTDLTLDPPSVTSDEAGAPLLDEDYPHPFDCPFGERAGVEIGFHFELR